MRKINILLFPLFLNSIGGWGYVYTEYGLGIPLGHWFNLVKFALGTHYVGIGSRIIESFSFYDREELTGAILPLYLYFPLHKRIKVEKGGMSYSLFSFFYIGGSLWGSRFKGRIPFDYITQYEWIADSDYFNFGIKAIVPLLNIFALSGSFGTVLIEGGKKTPYINLCIAMGTSGPITYRPVAPNLVIKKAVFDDSEGNRNGLLGSEEKGKILVLLQNKNVTTSRDIEVTAELIDKKFQRLINFKKTKIEEINPKEVKEVIIELEAAKVLPKVAYKIKISGRDIHKNVISPYFLIINSE